MEGAGATLATLYTQNSETEAPEDDEDGTVVKSSQGGGGSSDGGGDAQDVEEEQELEGRCSDRNT